MDAFLKDPLSVSDDKIGELLGGAGAEAPATDDADASDGQPEGDQAATANEQGETQGDAPGTGGDDGEEKGKQAEPPAAEPGDDPETEAKDKPPAGVASKDGKHVIPYEELRNTRERAARAEIMVQELTGKLEALTHEIETGKASKTRDLSDIVDPDVLTNLREESPEIADVVDKLIERNQQLTEQAQQASTAAAGADIDDRVQAVMTVEDAINATPKLAHVRTNDPATFSAIAGLDTMLGGQVAWKDKPLTDRFAAAVRMYEAANGAIELPGQQAQPKPAQQLPADTDARVKAALAKAEAAASGPSTLSDIPGGAPAAESNEDALAQLSSTALTERFMSMSPDQIEAELARLS